MKYAKNWWPLVFGMISIITLSVLGLWADLQCRPISSSLCSAWSKLSWETVLAGAIGLMGGLFVIVSTRMTISHEREHSAQTIVDQNLFLYLEIVAESRRYLDLAKALTGLIHFEQLDEDITEGSITEQKVDVRQRLKTIEEYRYHLLNYLQNEQVPFSFATELQSLVKDMGLFDEITGEPNEVGVVELFELSIIAFERPLARYRQRLIKARR